MFLRKNDNLDTLIGQKSEFTGNILTEGTCRIEGRFIGNIKADWVVIGETGKVKGDITARGIIIGGNIEGNVNADEIVEIKPTGKLFGDINSKKLSVAEGGVFEGRSYSKKDTDDTKILDFPAKESTG